MSARPPATREIPSSWRPFHLGVVQPQFGRIAPSSREATKANPAKAGDAKLRGYRTPFGARPVEPPNLTPQPGGDMHPRVRWLFVAGAGTALLTACEAIAPRTTGPATTVPPAQVVVTPDSVALDPSQTQQFSTFGRTATGDSVPVTVSWSASVGTITSSGFYTADTSLSDAVVTASLSTDPLSGTAHVKKKRVVQIVVTPASVTLPEGGGQQFYAYGRNNIGDSVSVSVTYAATGGIITLSGFYTAGKAPGNFRVTAKQTGSSLADSSAVSVIPVPVAAVSVSPASVSLSVGGTTQLIATPRDSAGNPLTGRTVSWSSSNGAVASVNASGVVSGVAAGSATITATSEGQSGTSAITVTVATVPVASVTVTPSSATILVGATVQLTATPKDSAGNPLSGTTVTWASSGTAVATVSASGLVTGKTAGSATMTATAGGKSGTAAVTVAPVPVASVMVTPSSATILVGATVQVTATPKDSAGNPLSGATVTWASSGTAVATVSASGLVTGKTAGSATITATAGGKSGTAAVTVAPVPVASVTVAPSSATILVGATVQLTATPKDSAGNLLSGRTVTWSTSVPAVATVSSSGVVTGVATGSAAITATSEGKNGTSAITVVTPPPVTSCTPTYGSFGVGTWPPACYRPYDSTAWINRPLPVSPQIDHKSAGALHDYDHPIYWSKASDPVYTISGCGGGGYSTVLNGIQIHALTSMLPGGGSDGHVAIMDQASNIEYDFWQATIDNNARTIGGTACGRLSIFGDGRVKGQTVNGPDGDGANAAITGLYAGQIRGAEIAGGKIQHGVAVAVTCTNGTFVYPATGKALTCGNANEPADGQFFQLTYSDAEIDALPVAAWKKTVLHAMHQYGFYVDDTGAGSAMNPVSFALHFESDKMFQAFGYEDPLVTYAKAHLGEDIYVSGGVYYYQIGTNIAWSRIQVIKPCVVQGTC